MTEQKPQRDEELYSRRVFVIGVIVCVLLALGSLYLLLALRERAVITGDMTHHPCQMAHPDWLLGDNDPKAAALTRWRLFAEWADQTILVIGTHFAAPTAGHVVRDGAAFRFAV